MRLKSQLEFDMSPMPNLSSAFPLFFNPNRIQIRTEFGLNSCGSQFITVPGPTCSFFLPIFSLSPPDVSELFLSAKPNGSSTRRAPIPNHPRSLERNNFNPKTICKDFLPHHPHPCLPSLHFLPGFLFISHKPKLHFLKKKQKKSKKRENP